MEHTKEDKMKEKILYASPTKMSKVLGITPKEMRDFVNVVKSGLLHIDKSFVDGKGETVTYEEFELVRSLAFYESYVNTKAGMEESIIYKTMENMNMPETDITTNIQEPEKMPADIVIDPDYDPDELPF